MLGWLMIPWVLGSWSQWLEAVHVLLGHWRHPMARPTSLCLLPVAGAGCQERNRGFNGQSTTEFIALKCDIAQSRKLPGRAAKTGLERDQLF